MAVSRRAKTVLWRAASRAEQEIRSYPRVYAAFYRALNASPAVRRTVGVVKAGVREDGTAAQTALKIGPTGPAERRRATATAVRLGLPPESWR